MHHGDEVNDETWADVHAADGMAVVVDQAVSYYCLNEKKVCINRVVKIWGRGLSAQCWVGVCFILCFMHRIHCLMSHIIFTLHNKI
jgi:hypothetical protein